QSCGHLQDAAPRRTRSADPRHTPRRGPGRGASARQNSARRRASAPERRPEVERSIEPAVGGTELEPKTSAERRLARRFGLRRIALQALTIRRVRRGRGFAYFDADGTHVRDRRLTRRLAKLAVPPAYENVLYARDPSAHLQAVGRDAAGR